MRRVIRLFTKACRHLVKIDNCKIDIRASGLRIRKKAVRKMRKGRDDRYKIPAALLGERRFFSLQPTGEVGGCVIFNLFCRYYCNGNRLEQEWMLKKHGIDIRPTRPGRDSNLVTKKRREPTDNYLQIEKMQELDVDYLMAAACRSPKLVAAHINKVIRRIEKTLAKKDKRYVPNPSRFYVVPHRVEYHVDALVNRHVGALDSELVRDAYHHQSFDAAWSRRIRLRMNAHIRDVTQEEFDHGQQVNLSKRTKRQRRGSVYVLTGDTSCANLQCYIKDKLDPLVLPRFEVEITNFKEALGCAQRELQCHQPHELVAVLRRGARWSFKTHLYPMVGGIDLAITEADHDNAFRALLRKVCPLRGQDIFDHYIEGDHRLCDLPEVVGYPQIRSLVKAKVIKKVDDFYIAGDAVERGLGFDWSDGDDEIPWIGLLNPNLNKEAPGDKGGRQ